MAVTVTDICRYPVKGLSAEHLERVALEPGEGLPHDRRFALAHGATTFDPHNPQWLPKTNAAPAPGSKHRILIYKDGQANWEGTDVAPDDPIPEL